MFYNADRGVKQQHCETCVTFQVLIVSPVNTQPAMAAMLHGMRAAAPTSYHVSSWHSPVASISMRSRKEAKVHIPKYQA